MGTRSTACPFFLLGPGWGLLSGRFCGKRLCISSYEKRFYRRMYCAGLGRFRGLSQAASHSNTAKTYFRNGNSLREGAPASVDGVEMGRVVRVRVRPELGECPVEINIVLRPKYDLSIPQDSVVQMVQRGVFETASVDIDTRQARGRRVENNGVLKSQELTDTVRDALTHMNDALTAIDKKMDSKKLAAPGQPIAPK